MHHLGRKFNQTVENMATKNPSDSFPRGSTLTQNLYESPNPFLTNFLIYSYFCCPLILYSCLFFKIDVITFFNLYYLFYLRNYCTTY